MSDDATTLRRQLEKVGYSYSRKPNGHYALLDPSGEKVRNENGVPLELSGTPSDPRWLDNQIAELRRAGIKVHAPTNGKRASIAVGRERRKQKSAELRARLKTVMHDHGLTQADVYHFGDEYARDSGFAKPGNSQTMISGFLKGSMLMDTAMEYVERVVSAIEQGGRPRSSAPVPGGLPPAIQVEGESTVKIPPSKPRVPELALELSRWVYSAEKDHERIEELLTEVAQLELREEES